MTAWCRQPNQVFLEINGDVLFEDIWIPNLWKTWVPHSCFSPVIQVFCQLLNDLSPNSKWWTHRKTLSWVAPSFVGQISPLPLQIMIRQGSLCLGLHIERTGENMWSKGENISQIIGLKKRTVCWWENKKAADQIRGFMLGTRTASSFTKPWTLQSRIRFVYFGCPSSYHRATHIARMQKIFLNNLRLE